MTDASNVGSLLSSTAHSDVSIPIIVAFVAGLFSLLGAFAGAWLARRSEYEKWLRQNRSEAYAKFLTALSDARDCATDVRYDTSLETIERGIKMTECYLKPVNYAQVVRLYLPPQKREQFILLVERYRAIHTDLNLNGSRFAALDEVLTEIQQILEKSLGN